jgi:hypothetical protein
LRCAGARLFLRRKATIERHFRYIGDDELRAVLLEIGVLVEGGERLFGHVELLSDTLRGRAVAEMFELRHLIELRRDLVDERSALVVGGDRVVGCHRLIGRFRQRIPGCLIELAGRLELISLLIGPQRFLEILAIMRVDFAR